MTRSSEDIEREVESARGNLDRTVEALKDKMTPGQLIDELSRSFKGGGVGDMMSNLGTQVRDNPMALAMIGAGMAWLMIGKNEHSDTSAQGFAPPPNAQPDASASSIHGLGGVVGDATQSLGEKTSEFKDAVRERASHATEKLHDLGGQATAAGRKAVQSFDDILQQEPLIVGALGLAVGVAIGAALPATTVENRTFGQARDDLLHAGQDRVAAVAQDLKASGRAAFEAVKSEADTQGFSGGEGQPSIVEKAEAVIRSGVEAARDEFSGSRST